MPPINRRNETKFEMPFSLIPFLLLFIPILEIAVFILIGGQIGVAYTLGMILVTAIIGTVLLRIQGFSILNRIQAETQAGRLPGKELVNGVMIMIAGVLLLTPGFVTDTIGFLLFVPFIRTVIWAYVGSKVSVTVAGNPSGMGRGPFDSRHDDRENGPDIVDLDEGDYNETPNPDTPWGDRDRLDRKP